MNAPRVRPGVLDLPVYGRGRTGTPVRHRLSSNESPFPPLPAVARALADAAQPHLYPPLAGEDLVGALALKHALPAERIWVSGGSIAVLEQVLRAFAGPGDEVVYSWRSYEAYPILVGAAGAQAVEVPLTPDAAHDLAGLLAAITERTRVLVLCNPNNPTGSVVPAAALREFVAAVPPHVLLVLDEAYREFVPAAASADGTEFLDRPNVAVLRTFSKAYGLAGLRVGYVLAAPPVVQGAQRLSLPFTVSSPALAAALAVLGEEEAVASRNAEVVAERARMTRALREAGYEVVSSGANFVWLPLGPATSAFTEAAAAGGVAVRPFEGEGVRVTVGSPEATDALLTALAERPAG